MPEWSLVLPAVTWIGLAVGITGIIVSLILALLNAKIDALSKRIDDSNTNMSKGFSDIAEILKDIKADQRKIIDWHVDHIKNHPSSSATSV